MITTPGTYYVDGGMIRENKSLIFLVGNGVNIHIKSDIKTQEEYGSSALISQVVFAPLNASDAYNIHIYDTVKRVDAWLLTPNGGLNTCYATSGGSDFTPRSKDAGPPLGSNACYNNRLIINGPVVAKMFLPDAAAVKIKIQIRLRPIKPSLAKPSTFAQTPTSGQPTK